MKDGGNTYIRMTFDGENEEVFLEGSRAVAGDSLVERILKKNPQIRAVPAETLQKNITETVLDFVGLLDEVDEKSGKFEIDEVEFGLSVGSDGSISIASVAAGSVNAQTTVRIRMKKRRGEK